MQWYEILIIVLAAAFVAGVGIWRIVKRKRGESSCDCGNCSHCTHCKTKTNSDRTDGGAKNS